MPDGAEGGETESRRSRARLAAVSVVAALIAIGLTSHRVLGHAPWPGLVAVAVGLAVLAAGLLQGGIGRPRGRAIGLFAAAWTPLPLGLVGMALEQDRMLGTVGGLGPALTFMSVEDAARGAGALYALVGWGWLLGLCGAGVALWRSGD